MSKSYTAIFSISGSEVNGPIGVTLDGSSEMFHDLAISADGFRLGDDGSPPHCQGA